MEQWTAELDTSEIDAAVEAMTAASRRLATQPQIEAPELSAQIAAARELASNLDHHLTLITRAYGLLGPLRHDQGGDAAAAVRAINGRLETIAALLIQVDKSFAELHNHAAHLAPADPDRSTTALSRVARSGLRIVRDGDVTTGGFESS